MTKYYVRFTKWWICENGDKKPDHTIYCIKELDSPSIERVFKCEYIKVDNMVVRERHTNRLIYSGNNYKEYLKAVKRWNRSVRK